MPNVTNIEIYEGEHPASSAADRMIPTTASLPKPEESEVSGHYVTSRIVRCWNCGGLSYATCDDTLTNQMFTCTACGQANQL